MIAKATSPKVFHVDTVRTALTSRNAIERLVRNIYGNEARFDAKEQAWFVSDVRGGSGDSCRIDTAGKYAGQFHDFADGSRTHGDLITLVQEARGISFREALQYIGDLLSLEPAPLTIAGGREAPQKPPEPKKDEDLAPISAETLKRATTKLWNEPRALAYLHGRGLTDDTIKRFKLGLLDPYPSGEGKDAVMIGPTIVSPIISRDGIALKRMPKTTIPGLTQNPKDEKGWSHGAPQSYWSGKITDSHRILFVCEGMKDLWRISQAIAGTSLAARVALVTSTHGSGIPDEWKRPAFWAMETWDSVYLGHDNDEAGEKMASKIRDMAPRPVQRVEVPRGKGKDWTDFFQGGGTLEEFERLLATAPRMARPLPVPARGRPLEDRDYGDYECSAVNINGAVVNGLMYYPYRVETVKPVKVKHTMPDGSVMFLEEKAFGYQTKVVRSDGIELTPQVKRGWAGLDDEDRIIALDDGTVITAIPSPREFATWRRDSILRYVQAVEAVRIGTGTVDDIHRPLRQIVDDVLAYIRTLTWLPNESDYALIAAYVLMSYVYNVFDAIPHLLLNGDKGSGKSTTAEGIADLAYNAFVLGAGSEKSLVRFVDQGRGLLVLDDLERVGRGGNEDGGYADINQLLKLSYSKRAAKKSITDKNGVTKILDFYGPKVITNISGIDAVNATRTFTITCRIMPKTVAETGTIKGRDVSRSEPLRQEMHAWGMNNVPAIVDAYRARLSSLSDRAAQIAAPLMAIADLARHDTFSQLLQEALERHSRQSKDMSEPTDFLKSAIAELIARGARKEISLLQIQMELAGMTDSGFKDRSSEALETLRNPKWLGHTLRQLGIRTDAEPRRQRLYGQIVRIYELEDAYVDRTIREMQEAGRVIESPPTLPRNQVPALNFCEAITCDRCPYFAVCPGVEPALREAKRMRKTKH